MFDGGCGAVLIGDGGGDFFARFRATRAVTAQGKETSLHAETDPLDAFTRTRVLAAVGEILDAEGIGFAVFHPFVGERVQLPFQRLGHAAGLPAPGPLGIQVHPVFGPWWAYRALVALRVVVEREPDLAAVCPSCARPCVNACALHRVMDQVSEPASRDRLVSSVCDDGCGARRRCPVGVGYGYSDDQIAFHKSARGALGATTTAS
jgi:hypothetical protein